MLDVLFVNVTNPFQNYQELSIEFSALEPPIWAGMLTRAVENFGWRTDIFDADVEELSAQQAANTLISDFPATKLVVFVVYGQQPSASTQNMPAALETFKYLRELNPDQHVMFLGLHPSALPEQTLFDMEEVQPFPSTRNYVCKGEGILNIDGLLRGNMLPNGVLGLYYRDGNSCVCYPPASPIKDLDKYFPGVPWDKLPMGKYRAHNWHCNFSSEDSRKPYASIYTSLGCPFNCSFCCINAPFGGPGYRCWSTDHVIKELDILSNKYGVKNLKIADELFVLNPKRIIELCDKMIERDYGFNIWAYARVDTCRPDLLEKLKLAGINWLALGIESGNIDIRKEVSKGKFQESDVYDVVELIKSFDISVLGNYIFGLPNDTLETMQQTLDLALRLQCEYSNFYTAMAYPGSCLYSLPENQKHLPEKSVGWSGYSQIASDCTPLPSKDLSSEEILKFRDNAFIKYYNDPDYLRTVENKFGKEAINGIKKMSSVSIKRKIYNGKN